MESTFGKKKMKWIFQTKKDFITYLKLIINELRRCTTRLFNVHCASYELALLAVLLLHFVLHMPNVIWLNLDYLIIDQRKLLKRFRCALCEIQANQSNFWIFTNWSIKERWIKQHAMKGMYGCFYERKKFLGCSM